MVRKVSGSLVVLCYLIVALGSVTLCQVGPSNYSPQECPDDDKIDLLYQKLERALINNSKALFQMKQRFFPVLDTHIQEVQILHLRACVRVMGQFTSSLSTTNISNEADYSIHCWNFKWSASALLSMISIDQLMTFDFLYVDMTYSAIQRSMVHKTVSITLSTDFLPCMPSESDLQETLVQLLSWAKAYARAHGRPDTWEERDRGYLSLWYNYWASEYISYDAVKYGNGRAEYIRNILLLTYIFLNIFIILMFMVARNSKRAQMQTIVPKTKQLYLQTVAVGITIANFLYIVVFLAVLTSDCPAVWATMKGSQTSEICESQYPPIPTGTTLYKDEKITFIVKYTTLPVTALIDLFLAVKASHSSHFPLSSKAVKLFGCFCCCCSQGMKSKILSKTFQTLLWWNVMLFIQIYVGQVALPVFILFIIAPGETVATVGMIALAHIAIATALVCLAQIVCYHCSRKNCGLACAELMALVVFLALLSTVATFYFEVLQAGSNVKGIKGAIISLAPSIVLSLTAWIIRKKIISQGKDNKISGMEMLTDRGDYEERMEEGRAFAEEQRNLLQSETESDGSDLGT